MGNSHILTMPNAGNAGCPLGLAFQVLAPANQTISRYLSLCSYAFPKCQKTLVKFFWNLCSVVLFGSIGTITLPPKKHAAKEWDAHLCFLQVPPVSRYSPYLVYSLCSPPSQWEKGKNKVLQNSPTILSPYLHSLVKFPILYRMKLRIRTISVGGVVLFSLSSSLSLLCGVPTCSSSLLEDSAQIPRQQEKSLSTSCYICTTIFNFHNHLGVREMT